MWILDWWRDLLFFIATPLLIGPLVLLPRDPVATGWFYLAVVTFIAVGHQLPGFLRVYGDGELVERFRTRLIVAPLLLLTIGLFCSLLEIQALPLVLLLWAAWHVATQAYGFARIYDSKVGSLGKSTLRLDFAMCLSWFGAGLVFSPGREEQLLRLYYQAGGPLISPTVVQAVQLLWGGLTAAVTVAFVMNYLSLRARGETASLLKLLAMVSSFGFWWFTMVNVTDVLLGIALFELFHAVQYLALVWFYGLHRAEQGGPRASTLRFLFRPRLRLAGLYLAMVALFGLPAFLAGVSPMGVDYAEITDAARRTLYGLVAASTMLHFYLEGFTWRLRDVRVRRALEVPEVAAAPARSLGSLFPHPAKWAFLLVPLALLGWAQRARDVTTPAVDVNLAEAVPQSWQAHARLGESLLGEGRVAEAAEELLLALEIRPDDPQTLCDLGLALRSMGKMGEALERFQRAVRIAPGLVVAQSELGKTLFGIGKTDEGLAHLETAVELNPRNPVSNQDLGLAQARLGKLEDALKSFTKAIELDDTMAEAYNARGVVYWNMDKWEEAQADLSEAIRLDPGMAKAYRNRAGLSLSRDDRQAALADYTNAITADGTNAMDYVMRGKIYYSLQQYDKAYADYEAGVRHQKRDFEATRTLVSMLLNCPDESFRNPAQAVLLAKEACQKTDWRNLTALGMLADACAAAGDYDEAVRWQEQSLAILPPDAPDDVRNKLQQQLETYRAAGLTRSDMEQQQGTPATSDRAGDSSGSGAPQSPDRDKK